MGEINFPILAPKASSSSLKLGRNTFSVQVVPSMFFMGSLRPFLQHLLAGMRRERSLD